MYTDSIEFLSFFFFSSPKHNAIVGEAKGLRFIRLFHVQNPWRDIDSALSSVNRPSNTGNEICPELSRLNIAPGFDFLPEGEKDGEERGRKKKKKKRRKKKKIPRRNVNPAAAPLCKRM